MKKIILMASALLLSACACPCKNGMMTHAAMPAMEAKTYSGKCLTVKVEGMTCESCAATVAANLKKNPNVEGTDIDVAKGLVKVHVAKGKTVSGKAIRKVIEHSGYTYRGVIANGC